MTLSEIRTRTRRLLGGISTNDYSNANLDLSVNEHQKSLIHQAIEASGEWRVSGDIAYADLVANQAEYPLPLELITLERVEVNTTGNTNDYSQIRLVDEREIGDAITNTGNLSAGYLAYLHDKSIFFDDAPDTAVTNGLRIWFTLEPTDLSGDGDVPVLDAGFHDALVYGACLDFALENKFDDDIKRYSQLLEQKRQQMIDHYANRTNIRRTRITTRTENYA